MSAKLNPDNSYNLKIIWALIVFTVTIFLLGIYLCKIGYELLKDGGADFIIGALILASGIPVIGFIFILLYSTIFFIPNEIRKKNMRVIRLNILNEPGLQHFQSRTITKVIALLFQ